MYISTSMHPAVTMHVTDIYVNSDLVVLKNSFRIKYIVCVFSLISTSFAICL